MILYPQYYRQHGIRRPVQLVAPTFSRLETLDLPTESILHFVSEDESLYGMPQDEYILRNTTRLVYVDHVREVGDIKGPPRPTRLPPGQMIRDYHRKHRHMRMVNTLASALRDGRTLLVENYGLLPHLYRYTTSFYRNYFKWWNIQAALWSKVNELAAISNREHFIECRLPTLIPTLAQVRKGEAHVNRSTIATFTEHESLFILEIWKWLGENRSTSVLAKASPAALAKVNLIWMEGTRWFVMNLGLLDAWRKPTEDELKAGAEPHGVVDAFNLQKRFLRSLMFLFEHRIADESDGAPLAEKPVIVPVSQDSTIGSPAEDLTKPVPTVVEAPVRLTVPSPLDGSKTVKITLKPGLNIDNLPDHFVEETEENMLKIDVAITKDLEALNHLHVEIDEQDVPAGDEPPVARSMDTATVKWHAEERTLENSVMAKADQMADAGSLTAAEYRRFTSLSVAYKKLADPYGKAPSLEAQALITPELLSIPDAPQIPDIDTVIDKSMLKSTLFDFDTKYVTEVLSKDVTNAVLAIQHGGIAVSGYQVEAVEDAINSYVAHTVNLVPVHGKPSTIHFRLPKVEEDGTFRCDGVRYRLRKQRGDLPIRKLSPDKVALTSYFAKIFVSRSDKQVHNYPGWLTNQIAARGMDPIDESVTHLMISNVFDAETHTPRMYSILAARFRSFQINREGWSGSFFFDYHARETQFGPDVVKAAEQNGLMIVGRIAGVRTKEILPIVMDKEGALYDLLGDKLNVLGTMESLLGIDARRAPSEVTVVKIFNKLIPVGVFLAYQMGLTRLLEVLQITPRRVSSGERVNLSDDEYALAFEDETLVFAKEHRMAAQVLTGFNVYSSAIANYPVHQFDRRDIYFNVLEQVGVGVRYLREMELLVDMFVDPITKEILETLKEPTDFIGLLLRSCELLLTDWSPAETDMAQMRIKGYERMAGAVYGELAKAVRVQRSRGNSNASIDIPPLCGMASHPPGPGG